MQRPLHFVAGLQLLSAADTVICMNMILITKLVMQRDVSRRHQGFATQAATLQRRVGS